jgi:hypothetical protein
MLAKMKIANIAKWVLVICWVVAIISTWVGGRKYAALAILLTVASLVIAIGERAKHKGAA